MPKKPTKNAKKTKDVQFRKNIIVVIAVLLGVGGYFGYQKYLDWQNKKLIEGMARDFPVLIAGIENTVHYPLVISADCLQTREKYSEGISLCGLTVGLSEENSKNIQFEKLINYFETQELGFKKAEIGQNEQGYRYTYSSKKACSFSYERRVYIDCAFGIRETNKPLAAELFNEEALNDRKNELLSW